MFNSIRKMNKICMAGLLCLSISAHASVRQWVAVLGSLGLAHKAMQEYKFRNDPYYALAKRKRFWHYAAVAIFNLFSKKEIDLSNDQQRKCFDQLKELEEQAGDYLKVPGQSKKAVALYEQADEEFKRLVFPDGK